MTHRYFPIVMLALAVLAVAFPSCGGSRAETVDKADSVVSRYSDSIYVVPANALEAFSKVQTELTDSQGYYKLELFKGIAGLISGDKAILDLSHERVADYIRRNPDDKVVEGIYWNHKAMVLSSMGDVDSAIACYENSYHAMSAAKDYARLSNVCINLGDMNRSSGKMAESARFYRRALFLADSLDMHDYDLPILSGLGAVYGDMGNYSESDKFFSLAKPLADNAAGFDAFFYYNSVGNTLFFQKKYDDALVNFRKAMNIAYEIEQVDLAAIAEVNVGEVMMYNNRIDSARKYLKSAERRFMSLPSMDNSAKFYLSTTLAGLALREDNLHEAKLYLSVEVDTLSLRPKYVSLHYHRMHEYYARKKDYKNAYEYERLAARYDDLINSDQNRNQMAEISYRYGQDTTILHKNMIISQQAEDVRDMSLAIYIVVSIIIVLVVLGVAFFAYRKKTEQVARLEMERSLVSLRMENIRNRVSPHFIFNVLNRELDANNEGIHRLVSLLRMNLDLCDRYIVSLSEEIEFVNTYVALETKALGDRFKYDLVVADNVDTDSYNLPSMMVQIFVENAIKHGLRGSEGDRWLRLSVGHHGNMLEIVIENNGCNHGVVAGKVGTGLKVVMQTIHILNERNLDKISLKYGVDEKVPSIWNVRIAIPDGYDFSIMR